MPTSRRATTCSQADFDERRYWRGPVWINTNWLLWWGLRQHGLEAAAEEVLMSSVRLVARSGFHEYFDPFTGEGFGTGGFGWTAALTLTSSSARTPPGGPGSPSASRPRGWRRRPTEQLPTATMTG